MSNLITETEDLMRREKMVALWNKNRTSIIAVLAGVVLGTGVYSGMESWKKSRKIKDTNALYAILEDKNFPQNVSADIKMETASSLQSLALLNAAGAYLQQEKPDTAKALSLYQRVATDKKAPKALQDLALLMQVRLMSNDDKADIPALIALLKPLTDDKNSPYQAPAQLEMAVLHGANGKYDEAKTCLEKIKETPLLPETLYMRAQALSHVYELKKNDTQQ